MEAALEEALEGESETDSSSYESEGGAGEDGAGGDDGQEDGGAAEEGEDGAAATTLGEESSESEEEEEEEEEEATTGSPSSSYGTSSATRGSSHLCCAPWFSTERVSFPSGHFRRRNKKENPSRVEPHSTGTKEVLLSDLPSGNFYKVGPFPGTKSHPLECDLEMQEY